ncbi:MAG: hypothetical protein AAF498_05820 [Pseudomonadota bacterium]
MRFKWLETRIFGIWTYDLLKGVLGDWQAAAPVPLIRFWFPQMHRRARLFREPFYSRFGISYAETNMINLKAVPTSED